MTRISISLFVCFFTGIISCPSFHAARAADVLDRGKISNPLFAFCFDQIDTRKRTYQQQANMLKQLGFVGMGHVGLDDLEDRLRALDQANLKLFVAGVRIKLMQPVSAYMPELKAAFPLLKGRGTIVYLTLGGAPPDDAAVVPSLRRIADEAAKWHVRVAIYPHTGDWVHGVDHAVRLAALVDRPNFGVIFNLCHWLKNENSNGLQPLLESAMPHLFLVTINGADSAGKPDKNWKRLIQPLDKGTFDVGGLVRMLHARGYRGPVGLMCWGIEGDARTHLSRSITRWRELTGQPTAGGR